MRIRKRRTAIIIGFIVAVLAAVAIVSLVTRVDKLETTKTVGNTFMAYEVGKLNDSGRSYKQSEIEDVDDYYLWMHTKEYVNPDGLKCKLADKAKIKYQIHFFDENYDFIKTVVCTTDYVFADNTDNALNSAKFAIVEIQPTADADQKISANEITKYAKMLTVTYNKFEDE